MVSCDVACHVMSCHLMWWSRDAMRCHGDELLSVVPAMGWNVMRLRCHWL